MKHPRTPVQARGIDFRIVDAIAADTVEQDKPARPTYLIWIIVALVAAAVIGFIVGSDRNRFDNLTGTAIVGNHVASIRADDTYYGVRVSVAWFDTSGSFHEDGWPDCLTSGSEVNVGYGVVPVTAPESGLTFYDVTYIDCAP